MRKAIFTICSRNYLAYALTLQQSVKTHEPDTPFFIYLADDPLDPGMTVDAQIIPARDLALPMMLDMAFRYTVMEFNTAIKADCFLDLLTRRGFDAAIYLDPDIQVFAPLAEVNAAFSNGASAVLTPHLLGPLGPDARPGEADIMQSGIFNLGFGAFAAKPESLAFIKWWAGKLHTDCYSAPEKGMFVDQRFVDFAPAFIANLSILRHCGYNVAYWNLARRKVTAVGTGWKVNEEPLVFFHFSGVVPGARGVVSKHLGAGPQDASDAVFSLIHVYQDSLSAAGHAHWSAIPYAFGRFRDGSPILPPMRRHPPTKGTAEDWFAAPDIDWWTAPDPRVDQSDSVRVSRLMMGFWEMRPDLQATFPISHAQGRRGLQSWFQQHGVSEYGIPKALCGEVAKLSPVDHARAFAKRLVGRRR